MAFRRLLVAFDDSPSAQRAVSEAVRLAESGHAQLTLIRAVAGSPPPPSAAAPVAPLPAGAVAHPEELHHALVAGALAAIPQDVPVTVLLRHGPPARVILTEAHTGNHDLLVMGPPARSRLLGGVGHEVLRRSPLPVLVASAA